MMSDSLPHAFCSELTKQGDEPLAGSAWTASRYIFISWSKNLWARNQYESQGFPPELKTYLESIQREKRIFTRLVHQNGNERKGHSRVFIFPDGFECKDVPIQDIESFLRAYLEDSLSEHLKLSAINRKILFCCTHGKRDRCCAKFGQAALYEFKRQAEEQNTVLDVWECTHINADRFAVNAVVFPDGYMYGGIRAGVIRELVDSLIQGYPFPPCFRGQLGKTSQEQVAMAFGHSYRYDNKIPNAKIIVEALDEVSAETQNCYVRIEDKDTRKLFARFFLNLVKKEFISRIDCDAVDANRQKSVTRWVVSESMSIT